MKNINQIEVILVDDLDNVIGQMEKMEAHQKGLLHRAFSVFVFNSNNELLLQRRAFGKYHSEGLWTNTCCSHPLPGEVNHSAANRRLKEEMGMTCTLVESFSFIYYAELDNNLIEHELDHVLIGRSDEKPTLNKDEAIDFKWLSLDEITKEIEIQPELYTFWFKRIIQDHYNQLTLQLYDESLQKRDI